MSQSIRVWGHRGCRGTINPPENSVPAFVAAMEQGADGIELDVFLTSDDQLVVFHDDELDRMTNGHGDITSFALSELRQLRLKDNSGSTTSTGIPTLEEVLDAVDHYRKQHSHFERMRDFTVNIEIKEMKGKNIAAFVATTIAKYLGRGSVPPGWKPFNFQVSSFDMESLRKMKKANAAIPLGALLHGGHEPWDITEKQLAEQLAEMQDLQPQTVNITLPSLTPAAVRLIRNTAAEPVGWTCNEKNPDDLSPSERRTLTTQLIENRIPILITDYPKQMMRLLEESGSPRAIGHR